MFNVLQFLNQYRIPYVDRGSNVARGNVNIQCPWCGPSDTSQHMGISLETGWYGCWRNSAHRGKHPSRLVRQLIGCSKAEADSIVGVKSNQSSNFDNFLKDPFGSLAKPIPKTFTGIAFPHEFRPLGMQLEKLSQKPYLNYLHGRGFDDASVDYACNEFNLHYCLSGRWAQRIIVPVTYRKLLAGWTGRAIQADEKKRYMALTADEKTAKERGDPIGAIPVNRLVLNYDNLMENRAGAKDLFICEGPFDAIKLDTLGGRHNIRATCIFTLSITPEQESLLSDLADSYRLHILLDATAYHNALQLQRRLAILDPTVVTLPDGYKDPGDLDAEGIETLLGSFQWKNQN